MYAFRRMLAPALVCLGTLVSAQQPDVTAAARILGPQWKQISRAAGMVFAGTVLEAQAIPAANAHALPTIEIRFRVDRAIAGAQLGQVLTVREWTGAWSTGRTMRPGQRVLLFLYPPSRLGLTSPVGGPLGQVPLDAKGEIVAPPASADFPSRSALSLLPAVGPHTTLRQLERAIRSAREE
jgi:hypothetical protein